MGSFFAKLTMLFSLILCVISAEVRWDFIVSYFVFVVGVIAYVTIEGSRVATCVKSKNYFKKRAINCIIDGSTKDKQTGYQEILDTCRSGSR